VLGQLADTINPGCNIITQSIFRMHRQVYKYASVEKMTEKQFYHYAVII